MTDLLFNFGAQLLFTVGIVVASGLIISLLRQAFVCFAGNGAYWVLLITGVVGTPVHELSHALMCLIFGHRIDSMTLYRPCGPGGSLGYVQHSYNQKNLYHNIGHFFIGTAPIFCGGLVLLLLMRILVPDVYFQVAPSLNGSFDVSQLSFDGVMSNYGRALLNTIGAIFRPDNLAVLGWWVFIILAVMIACHMELSVSDVRSGAVGFAIISVILFVVDLVLWLILPSAMVWLTEKAGAFSLYLAGFLSLALIAMALMLLGAVLYRLVQYIARRIKYRNKGV